VGDGADFEVGRSIAQSDARQVGIYSLRLVAEAAYVVDRRIGAARLSEPADTIVPHPDRPHERAATECQRNKTARSTSAALDIFASGSPYLVRKRASELSGSVAQHG